MNHADYEQLAAGFALRALEPDEEHVFQRHLEGCATCQATLRDLEELAGALALAAPAAEPPAALRAAIRRGAGLTAWRRLRRRLALRKQESLGSWRGSRLVARAALAVGVAALFALSLWNLALRQQHSVDRFRVASLEAGMRLLNDSAARTIRLAGPAGGAGARATVLVSSRQDRGVLVVEGLPEPRRGRVYELWALPQGDAAQSRRALAFRVGPGVRVLPFSVPLQPATAFTITDEPGPRGSDQPTTEPILSGTPERTP